MKITVELSDKELRDVFRLTGEKKKGPAIRKVVVDALMLQRRREIADKFVSGEWGVELSGYDDAKARAKSKDAERSAAWRS